MKKILFTTTALVAGAMISSAAMADGMNSYRSSSMKSSSMYSSAAMKSARYAQQNDLMGKSAFKASLGGYANWMVGYADNDKEFFPNPVVSGDPVGANEFDVMGDAEVHFNFEAALKNGMKVGYTAQLVTDTRDTSDSILDDTYMWVESAYGKVMVGRHDNVNEQLMLGAVDLGALDIQETDLTRWIISPAGIVEGDATYFTFDKELTKVSYLTPNFSGFQAGLTYAPRGGDFKDNVIHTDPDDTTLYNEALDATILSAAYNAEMDGVGFGISAGYGFTTVVGEFNDEESSATLWNVGARVAYQGFSLAAAYKSVDNGDRVNSDSTVWDIGVAYETGPYGVSLSYLTAEDDYNQETSTWLLSGVYNMAAGVDAFATFGYGDYEAGNTDAEQNDGFALITGMMLSF